MEIGEEDKPFTTEPVEDPFETPEEKPEPEKAPEPEKKPEREKVPA